LSYLNSPGSFRNDSLTLSESEDNQLREDML